MQIKEHKKIILHLVAAPAYIHCPIIICTYELYDVYCLKGAKYFEPEIRTWQQNHVDKK
jgi:hypothetical protein